jgi:hypothetical protein
MTTIIGTLPNILTNGTVADASQVMADFNFIVNQVNANAVAASASIPGTLLDVQLFAASGTYTPNANATKAFVFAVGGGGAGGGGPATGTNQIGLGTGGNGGAYGEMFISAGLTSQTVTVGASGLGVAGTTGGAGGSTSFGSLMVCAGGAGGGAAGPAAAFIVPAPGAFTGVSGSGNILVRVNGGLGGLCLAIGAAANDFLSGVGGSSFWSAGGAGSQGGNGGNSPNAGGGGGGGCTPPSTGASTGGSGGPGLLMVYEFA